MALGGTAAAYRHGTFDTADPALVAFGRGGDNVRTTARRDATMMEEDGERWWMLASGARGGSWGSAVGSTSGDELRINHAGGRGGRRDRRA